MAEGAADTSPVTMKAPAVPKSRQAQIPPATAEELQTIYAAMPTTTRISVWLGAILDLRIGEVVSLQVQDWNPKNADPESLPFRRRERTPQSHEDTN